MLLGAAVRGLKIWVACRAGALDGSDGLQWPPAATSRLGASRARWRQFVVVRLVLVIVVQRFAVQIVVGQQNLLGGWLCEKVISN